MASDQKENQNNHQQHDGGAEDDGNICRDYQRGVCHRGSKCKFNHPSTVEAPAQERLPICRDFQNGKCSRNNCKYMHITSEEERIYMRTGQLPPSNSDQGSNHSSDPSLIDQVCKDFLNNICNRGMSCKFRHISEEEYQRQKDLPGDAPRKRRRESFGSGGGMDVQFFQEENDMLRRKVADLQRQVADLRSMNDTLYEQNTRYRSQMQGMDSGGRSNPQYSGYGRDTTPVPTYNYPPPPGTSSYDYA